MPSRDWPPARPRTAAPCRSRSPRGARAPRPASRSVGPKGRRPLHRPKITTPSVRERALERDGHHRRPADGAHHAGGAPRSAPSAASPRRRAPRTSRVLPSAAAACRGLAKSTLPDTTANDCSIHGRLLSSIGGERHAGDLPILVEHVDDRVVGEERNGGRGERLQRLLVVQGFVECGARIGQEGDALARALRILARAPLGREQFRPMQRLRTLEGDGIGEGAVIVRKRRIGGEAESRARRSPAPAPRAARCTRRRIPDGVLAAVGVPLVQLRQRSAPRRRLRLRTASASGTAAFTGISFHRATAVRRVPRRLDHPETPRGRCAGIEDRQHAGGRTERRDGVGHDGRRDLGGRRRRDSAAVSACSRSRRPTACARRPAHRRTPGGPRARR